MRRVVLLFLFMAGCSLFGERGSSNEVSLATDRSTYIAHQEQEGPRPRYGFDLVARFHNGTRRTVYLERCNSAISHPIYAVEFVEPGDEWGSAYNAAWACVGSGRPFAVKPGRTRTDTLHIAGPNAWPNGSGRHDGKMEGRFRLLYPARTCQSETGCTLPDSLTRSVPFEVSVATSDTEDSAAEAAGMLVGSWQWHGSMGANAGQSVWPGTSGFPARVLQFDQDGLFRFFEADTLAVSGRYVLERDGINHVIRYETESGDRIGMMQAQFFWFERENTLNLDDSFSCADCYVHRYNRIVQ